MGQCSVFQPGLKLVQPHLGWTHSPNPKLPFERHMGQLWHLERHAAISSRERFGKPASRQRRKDMVKFLILDRREGDCGVTVASLKVGGEVVGASSCQALKRLTGQDTEGSARSIFPSR